jgi:glycerophosphoryl diester phosphodiesterase
MPSALRKTLAKVAVVASLVLFASGAGHAFDLQGHRGARGLAPENTLAAFAMALAMGVTTLETDLARTLCAAPTASGLPSRRRRSTA